MSLAVPRPWSHVRRWTLPHALLPLLLVAGTASASAPRKLALLVAVADYLVGGLSLALCHALADVPRGASYRALFAEVQAEMATTVPRQTPRIEGEVDAVVLRGEVLEQVPWLAVTAVEGAVATVAGGALLGLLPGTGIAFLPPGTADPAAGKPLATGTVSRADADGARVALDADASPEKLRESWAFVTKQSFGDLAARVALDASLPAAVRDGLGARLAQSGLVTLTAERPDLLLAWTDGAPLATTADGDRLEWDLGDDPVAGLARWLTSFARSQYLKGLDLTARGLDVQFAVVPAEIQVDAAGGFAGCRALPPDRWPTEGGQLTLREGDAWMLRLENRGANAAWVTVLDLPSDGSVTQLWPDPEQRASDNEIAPGRTQLIQDPCFGVQPPFGTEVIKLFATREPLDLRPILHDGPAPAGVRGTPPGPLEVLLGDALGGQRTRGAGVMRLPAGSAATSAVVLRVERTE